MGSRGRRTALYVGALILLSGLAYGGFLYRADPDPQTFLNAAEELERHGLHRAALVEVERALAVDPDLPYAHVIGGLAAQGIEDWDRSLAFFRRAVELYPDEQRKTDLAICVLRVLVLAGRHEEAETRAAALREAGAPPVVSFLQGASREAAGDREGALTCYRTAMANDGSADAYFAAAALLADRGDRDEAMTLLKRGLDEDRSRTAAWSALAELQLEAGDRASAVASIRTAAALDTAWMRRELRRNPVWKPLLHGEEIADLLAAAPPRAPE